MYNSVPHNIGVLHCVGPSWLLATAQIVFQVNKDITQAGKFTLGKEITPYCGQEIHKPCLVIYWRDIWLNVSVKTADFSLNIYCGWS